jgi:hypothetical protein
MRPGDLLDKIALRFQPLQVEIEDVRTMSAEWAAMQKEGADG